MELTDEQLRTLAGAWGALPDRIQGFSYGNKFGPPHVVRDVYLPPSKQELWRGDDHDEMIVRCRMEQFRLVMAKV